MPRARSTFKLADVTRAIRAVEAAGKDVVRTQILPDGTIVLIHGPEVTSIGPVSDFDRLEAEL